MKKNDMELFRAKKTLNKFLNSKFYKFIFSLTPSIKNKLKKINALFSDIEKRSTEIVEDKTAKPVPIYHKKINIEFSGYNYNQIESGYIEKLSDEQLQELNKLLPWNCFTVDLKGRRFGDVAWSGKRDKPQLIPDDRISMMDQKFSLKNKSVFEVGCFEAIHTIGLCKAGAIVDAVDVRVENVVKTIVRSAIFGFKPNVYCLDIEKDLDEENMKFDLVHHVGVLYHLKDPVAHLIKIAKITKQGLMLDTHYADNNKVADKSYAVNGKEYSYYHYKEKGYKDVFSGAYDHAKWITLEDIKEILISNGFSKVEVAKDEQQKNGQRCLIFAYK